MQLKWGQTEISIVKGDITDQDVDAIVNAANSTLLGGLGVDGAIHKRGGFQIFQECLQIRRDQLPEGLQSGRAVITTGGALRARHVIHTVGPIWGDGLLNEDKTLAECYRSCLGITKEKAIRSVAFPAISTGAYGYPLKEATEVALRTVNAFVTEEGWPEIVVFVLFDSEALEMYERMVTNFNAIKGP